MRLQKNSLGRMTRNRVMGSDPLLSYLHVIPMGTGEVYMECDSGPLVSGIAFCCHWDTPLKDFCL